MPNLSINFMKIINSVWSPIFPTDGMWQVSNAVNDYLRSSSLYPWCIWLIDITSISGVSRLLNFDKIIIKKIDNLIILRKIGKQRTFDITCLFSHRIVLQDCNNKGNFYLLFIALFRLIFWLSYPFRLLSVLLSGLI